MSEHPIIALPKSQMYRDMSALGLYDLVGNTLVRSEMQAYMSGVGVLLDLLEQAAGDSLPQTSAEPRLRQWEEILALPLRPRASPDQRRDTVRALLALGPGDHGPEGAARCLAAAGITAVVAEDFLNQKLLVTVERFEPEYDSVYHCIQRARTLLPAHMEAEFDFGGPDWTRWEAANGTWAEFDAADLTWQERDTARQ